MAFVAGGLNLLERRSRLGGGRTPRVRRSVGVRMELKGGEHQEGGGDEQKDMWREFRAQMVLNERGIDFEKGKPWCHTLSAPESGCLLLANPQFFMENQRYFRFAVILLLNVDEDGAHGVILNKRLRTKLSNLWPGPSVMAENRLHFGGDVGESSYFFLHPYGEMKGASRIMNGVYCGGIEEVIYKAEEGVVKPDKVKVFHRCCGWAPQQLEKEIENKVWFPAACSKELILDEAVDVADSDQYWNKVLSLMRHGYILLKD